MFTAAGAGDNHGQEAQERAGRWTDRLERPLQRNASASERGPFMRLHHATRSILMETGQWEWPRSQDTLEVKDVLAVQTVVRFSRCLPNTLFILQKAVWVQVGRVDKPAATDPGAQAAQQTWVHLSAHPSVHLPLAFQGNVQVWQTPKGAHWLPPGAPSTVWLALLPATPYLLGATDRP